MPNLQATRAGGSGKDKLLCMIQILILVSTYAWNTNREVIIMNPSIELKLLRINLRLRVGKANEKSQQHYNTPSTVLSTPSVSKYKMFFDTVIVSKNVLYFDTESVKNILYIDMEGILTNLYHQRPKPKPNLDGHDSRPN
jgi:hypothetical protein